MEEDERFGGMEMDSPELLKKKTSGSQFDSAKSAAQTEHIDRATSGLPRIDGRLSDSVYGENRRGEAFGYITQRQGTGRDTAVSQADVVQREPERGPLDRTINSLGEEKLSTLINIGDEGVDASISNGKEGSLYFENGRIRLIHPHGPEISVKKRIRRFAALGDKKELERELRKKHTMGVNEEWINGIKCDYRMTELTPEVMKGNIPKGQLVELFFDGDTLIGHHFSRGSLQKYKIEPSAKKGEKAEPKDRKEEGEAKRENSQQLYAIKIAWVAAASQEFGEILSKKIMESRENGKDISKEDIVKDIVGTAIKEVMAEQEVPVMDKIVDENDVVKIVNEVNNGLRKRLQGYFANKFFRASGIVEEMGLQVENTDPLPEQKKL